MDWVDKPQNNYKNLYGILQLLRGSHLNNFPLKALKLGWVAFHSVTSQLKCLDLRNSSQSSHISAIGYALRTTYLIFETFQILSLTASLIFTTARLFYQVI